MSFDWLDTNHDDHISLQTIHHSLITLTWFPLNDSSPYTPIIATMSGTDPIKPSDLVDKHSNTPLDDNTVPTTLSHVPSPPPTNPVDIVLQDQSIRLPLSRLLMIYFGIGLALVLSFMDQTSVSTAAPVIGTDIGGSERYGGTLEVST